MPYYVTIKERLFNERTIDDKIVEMLFARRRRRRKYELHNLIPLWETFPHYDYDYYDYFGGDILKEL